MSKNDGLILAAIIGGVLILPNLFSSDSESENPLLNIFPSGESGSMDLSGIFSGLNSLLGGVSNAMGTIGGLAGSLLGTAGDGSGSGGAFDLSAFLAGLLGGQGNGSGGGDNSGGGNDGGGNNNNGGGSWWDTPIIYPSGSTTVDWGNVISQGSMAVAKAALTGAGVYVGAKAVSPLASSVGKALSTPVSQVLKSTGSFTANTTKSVLNVGSKGITGFLSALTKPVSVVPKLGVAGAVLTTGLTAYSLTNWALNNTSVGQTVLEKTTNISGQLGTAFGQSSIGQKVYGVAQVNTQKTDAAFAKIGLTTSQVQSYFKTNPSGNYAGLLKYYNVNQN